ncbi:MAG: hypothetical protein MUF21_08345 [Gemmatimonadaceae bacterium]|nr:hypothetical protein [Gemmatimonadaceae bacterium]
MTPHEWSDFTAARDRLPQTAVRRYGWALLYLELNHPGTPTPLPTGATAQPLAAALDHDRQDDAILLAALKQLPLADARRAEAVLLRIVHYCPTVEYIAVDNFTASFTTAGRASAAVLDGDDYIRYDSELISIRTRVYAVTPANQRYSLGFIQLCDARNQRHIYADHGLELRWEITGTYPVSDAANATTFPFYNVGYHTLAAIATVAAARDVIPSATTIFEMTDAIGSYADQALSYTHGTTPAETKLARVSRTQRFRAWFAYTRDSDARGANEELTAYANRFHVLQRVDYAYAVDFPVTWPATGAPTATFGTATGGAPTVTPCPADERIPREGFVQRSMNNEDKPRIYRGGMLVGEHGIVNVVVPLPPARPLPPVPVPVPAVATRPQLGGHRMRP